jgi:hypothetical protein
MGKMVYAIKIYSPENVSNGKNPVFRIFPVIAKGRMAVVEEGGVLGFF